MTPNRWQSSRREDLAADVQAGILASLDHGILRHLAILAADDERGQLTFEVDQRFGEEGAPRPAERGTRGLCF